MAKTVGAIARGAEPAPSSHLPASGASPVRFASHPVAPDLIHARSNDGDGSTTTVKVAGVRLANGQTSISDFLNNGSLNGLKAQAITINSIAGHNPPGYYTNQSAENSSVVCFTRGTRIAADAGAVPVENLRVGNRIPTRDDGVQEIRRIGGALSPAHGDLAPVEFVAGAIGSAESISVSPQHRMLIRSVACDYPFGETEVLVPAVHFAGMPGVKLRTEGYVQYFHILFDRHELVLSDGCWTESFYPEPTAPTAMPNRIRDEVIALFPKLREMGAAIKIPVTLVSLNKFGAKVLFGEIKPLSMLVHKYLKRYEYNFRKNIYWRFG